MSESTYVSHYTERFQEQYLSASSHIVERVRSCVIAIESMPRLGREYNPSYEADLPPFSCRYLVVPGTSKCLFYTIDDDAKMLHFFMLIDTRQDPRTRFAGIQSDR